MVRRFSNRATRWTREAFHYLLMKQLIATLPPFPPSAFPSMD